jgi:DNA repair exonuclease SbcCD ATPase subunit
VVLLVLLACGYLTAARVAQTRIHDAIERAESPHLEVGREVDSLLAVMERSAQRAQLLHEALGDTAVARIEGRLHEVANTNRHELANALEQQLEVQRHLQEQFDRFKDEMERIVVELETVRAGLLSVSASTDADNQQRLTDRVRGLRDEMTAVATGMSAEFD